MSRHAYIPLHLAVETDQPHYVQELPKRPAI